MNYKEALRKAEQPQTSSLLNQILETVRERFPGQSDDNLLTMILEVCKLSLITKFLTKNEIPIFTKFLTNPMVLGQEKQKKNKQTRPVAIRLKIMNIVIRK